MIELRTGETADSPFKKQLEKQALQKIIFLVIVGCLLFCIPIFGLNYLNQNFNMEEHLNFLNRTFDEVYEDVTAYLEDEENEGLFLRCMTGVSDSREVQYSLSKHNVVSPVRVRMILMNREKQIVYTSFGQEAMNLHRTEFNKIVADNALKANLPIYTTVYYFSGDSSECVFAKPVYQHGVLAGFVMAYLNGNDWGSLFSGYQYDCIITNLNGDIIYCSKSAFLSERNTNKYKADPSQHFVTVQENRYRTGARVLTDKKAVLYSFVYSPGNSLYIIIGVMTIVLLGCIWLVMFRKLSQMMAEKTAQSVEALVGEIRVIRHGDNEHIIQIDTGDEVEEIAAQINKMVKSINELNTRNTDLIKLNSMIEMRNLQTQINPHFIYNTLDNIKYLILGDAEKASYLLEKFTHILRYSINNTKQDVLLSEDIGYIEDYLYIQKTRFGERFRCRMKIEPDCSQCMIPKLLLQPLIENSIKYGFQKQMELSVQIRAWCEDDYLFLRVEDDGPGVPVEMLERLQSMIVSEGIKTEHNGLQNLSRRIILEYGEECGLFINSEEGKNFTVTAKLLRRGRKDV
ncbi:sensor histidine kinase [Caproiciproducens sp. CPB-2]|uniref:sensor histidine kinase n=1 Tax=Caproiciproducens sp. CPB-2 TaxID=3030017 RepID=UPI0023DA981F|nr:histidine kinase [Caproiciproducens sp. CPB-2]MDF1493854.1 histidine kinase [Caproiciproducens sp. CPB-2]